MLPEESEPCENRVRSRPSSSPCIRALLGLGLVVAAATGTSWAGDPPPPGAILGTVVREADGAPVAYANVLVVGTTLGAITDELGGFAITGITAGRMTVRIQALGGPPLTEDIDLAPGDTLRRTYRLALPARDRFLEVRDSLTALGQWPPTLDRALDAHMRESIDVRVFRLDPDHPVHDAPPDPEHRIGPWPIVRESDRPERALVDGLLETLRRSELYIPRIKGEVKVCAGGFAPGIDVRFVSTGVAVDVLLCYRCGEFSIWRDGKGRQAGDFMGYGGEFVRFAQRMFPRDKALKKLSARDESAAR